MCMENNSTPVAQDTIVLPEQHVEETFENRKKAVMEFAWAYHRKNPYVQYDITNLCAAGRRARGARTAYNMSHTPEMAGPQRNIFAHCQLYGYQCIYHAFDHMTMGRWEDCYTNPIIDLEPPVAPYAVFHYINTQNEEEDLRAMHEMFAILQPGDVICYNRYKTHTPHHVIWAGDVDGDGVGDLINSCGTPYNHGKKKEIRETYGSIWVNMMRWDCRSGEDYFANKEKAFDYFPSLKGVTVLRYTDPKHARDYPITERAKTRVLYPGLDICYEVEHSLYGCAVKGKELTYTLKLKNFSGQNHWGILVQLPVPKNAIVTKIDGKKAENGIVRWEVNLPAGSEVTHSYTVKATGKVGSVIDTGTGYVHAIPLPTFTTAIVSEKADKKQVAAAIEKAKSKKDFLSAYLTAMGGKVNAPSVDEIKKTLFHSSEVHSEFDDLDYVVLEQKPDLEESSLSRMQIPYYFGGTCVSTPGTSLRVKELRSRDLTAGDILLWQEEENGPAFAAVHNGKDWVLPVKGQLVLLSQEKLDEFITYHFFIALRPTQAV